MLQSHQFAVGRHLLTRYVAEARFAAEQRSCDSGGIKLIRFRSQPALLSEGMHLGRM
jgi:hypothetical protein